MVTVEEWTNEIRLRSEAHAWLVWLFKKLNQLLVIGIIILAFLIIPNPNKEDKSDKGGYPIAIFGIALGISFKELAEPVLLSDKPQFEDAACSRMERILFKGLPFTWESSSYEHKHAVLCQFVQDYPWVKSVPMYSLESTFNRYLEENVRQTYRSPAATASLSA